MAISDTDVLAIYTANGSNTNFAIPFDHIVGEISSVIRVATRDPSTLAISLKTLGSDYTLSPVESVVTNTKSTTVVFATAPPNGHKVMVFRVQARTQPVQYQNNGPFLAKDHEKALDRILLTAQEIAERGGQITPNLSLGFLGVYRFQFYGTPSGGETLVVNENGNGFEYGPTVAEIEEWKDDAEASANAAASSASSASSSASAASGSASAASASAIAAASSASAALASQTAAEAAEASAIAASLSAVNTIGNVGSTPNAQGGSIAANTLTLQPASSSHPGVMTTGTQTFAGAKAWTGNQLFESTFDIGASASAITESGNDANVPATQMTKIGIRISSGSLNSIAGFENPANDNYKFYVLMNASSVEVVLRNQSTAVTGVRRIITGTGSDLTMAPGSSLIIVYDKGSDRWRVVGGAGGGGAGTAFGSVATPRSVSAGTGITAAAGHMSSSATEQVVVIKGDAPGENDITADPQIQAHTVAWAKMRIYGGNDADFVKLETGAGLLLNGDWYSYAGNILDLTWNGTVWAEAGRNK